LGRAADAPGLTHPALSKSLRRLERSTHAKLVQRTAKGVDLTSEGQALLAHVRGLRLSLADVMREVAELSQGRAGHLRIGSGPGVEPRLLPSACGALLLEGSRATFKVSVATNDLLIPALRNGEFDLIVGGIPTTAHADLIQEALYADESQRLLYVRSAGHGRSA
jgi:DNA-binding transcriptional LysR family regulator